jgi:hypothetical protein
MASVPTIMGAVLPVADSLIIVGGKRGMPPIGTMW